MALDRIILLTIPVTDQNRAREYYVDRLGFETAADYVMSSQEAGSAGEGARWLMLTPPGGGADVLLSTWSTTPGTARFAIGCDDADAAAEDLQCRGVDLLNPVQDAGFGRWFGLEDPDGNQLLVVQER